MFKKNEMLSIVVNLNSFALKNQYFEQIFGKNIKYFLEMMLLG